MVKVVHKLIKVEGIVDPVYHCRAWRWVFERASNRCCGSRRGTAEVPGHPFYTRLNALLTRIRSVRRRPVPRVLRAGHGPTEFGAWPVFSAARWATSRASIRTRDRVARDRLVVRSFLRLGLEDAPPDHSTISRTRRLIDVETHRAIFTWVQQRLVEAGLLKGKTVAIDATTLRRTPRCAASCGATPARAIRRF